MPRKTTVTLVYPFFRSNPDKSIFRFPPLGLGYIVSYLKQHGVSASLVDCTFLTEAEALEQVRLSKPRIIGIYSMFSMKKSALRIAKLLKANCELLVAGGPLPTLCPEDFLNDFDVVCVGEGETTTLELVEVVEGRRSLSTIKGIFYQNRNPDKANVLHTPPREFVQDLDALPFPARDSFDHEAYKKHYK